MYLDHAATTPLRPEARDAWWEASELVGNPASIHSAGQEARRLLEDSRERLAAAIGCDPVEVVLTSGGTESINLAISGLFAHRAAAGPRTIVAPAAEHRATIDTVEALVAHGAAEASWVPVDADGRLEGDAWSAAVGADGVAVGTLLAANNEVGTLQPVLEATAAAATAGVPLHLDAVGAFGHLPLSFRAMREASQSHAGGLVAMSLAAHKIGGPVGVGALVVSRDTTLEPLLHGGGHQRGLRAGTQDIAGAAAFAVAAELAVTELAAEGRRLSALRGRLEAGLRAAVPEAIVSAREADRLPGHLHVVFPEAQGDSLLLLLDMAGISVSTGSACQAGVPEPSHVLLAMGVDADLARGALRFTPGRTSSDADVDAVVAAVPAAYQRARAAGHSSRRSR